MLTIDNLTISYGPKVVLSSLRLSMEAGRIYGIIGFNGTGKTTLLNAIYGIPRQKDCIYFAGKPLSRTKIAYLETETFFYSRITGRDYLDLFKKQNKEFDFEMLCEMFNIPMDNFIDTYSTGMKKKLALVGILSLDREIILLDEPFNGLDLESVMVLQLMLKKISSSGRLVIVTSHIFESLSSICDTILLLEDGIISKSYIPSEYMALRERIQTDIVTKYNGVINHVF